MSEHMKIFTDVTPTLVGLVIFVLLFAAFIVSTYLPSQKNLHRRLERLPLDHHVKGDANEQTA